MPDPEVDIIDRTRFAELIRRWSEDTGSASSPTRIADHPACREIVAMGEVAVPLILEELEDHPSIPGLVAPKAIVGMNPFPPEARGDVARMARAWLAWGLEHGYRR
jgi:hypothetical protein